MTLHVFQSTGTVELFGFTIDPDGANLPEAGGPWEPAGDAIPLGATMASTSPEISGEVARYGYAIVKGHSVAPPEVRRGESAP